MCIVLTKCRNSLAQQRESRRQCPEVSQQAGEPEFLPAPLLCVSRMLPAPLMTYQYQRSFIKAASESFTPLPLKVAFRGGD